MILFISGWKALYWSGVAREKILFWSKRLDLLESFEILIDTAFKTKS